MQQVHTLANVVPELFTATQVCTRSGTTHIYQDLSKVKLSTKDKLWLCQLVDPDHDKTSWGQEVLPKKTVIRRYNLPSSFFINNYRSYKKFGCIMERGGQPFHDPEGEYELLKQVAERSFVNDHVSISELNKLATEQAIAKKRKRGIVVDPEFNKLHDDTIRRYIKKRRIIVKSANSQLTDARLAAIMCPYMSYVWYIVAFVLSAFLPPWRKWNADASTYVFNAPKTGEKYISLSNDEEAAYIDEYERNIHQPNVLTQRKKNKGKKNDSNRLAVAIKVMQMCNAQGDVSPFVCVVAIPSFQSEQWHVEIVRGLSHTCVGSSVGYLYFSRNRCGTEEMWKHYFLHVALPTIKNSNMAYSDVDNDVLLRNFFSTDGEAIIMKNAYKDDVIDAFEDAKTDYGRVGASTTGIHNACDRAYTFRETKKSVRQLTKNGAKISNTLLELGLKKAFENLKLTFASLQLTSHFISCITEGLLTLTRAYQETMTPQMVKNGFSICGQHCDPKEPGGPTVDFARMMYQCYSDISAEQMELMEQKTNYFSDILRTEGRITYHELKDAGINPGTTTIDRTNLTSTRHWSEIINHEKTVLRYRAEVAARHPDAIQQRQLAVKDSKILKKQQAKVAKELEKERKKDQRILEREAEKQRILTLTPEQLASEKAAKRIAAQQRAIQIEAEYQEDLADALKRQGKTMEI